MKRLGVLALQGGFDAHLRSLRRIGAPCAPVTTLDEIRGVTALIIPGGESTTIGKLLVQHRMLDELRSLISYGLPVFGTCAGMILLAKEAATFSQPLLQVLDITVARNAYGRQTSSFETELDFQNQKVPSLFIRAPQITRMGSSVSTLITYENLPVMVRQGTILAASFHPELTDSPLIHEFFLSIAGF